MTWPEKPFHRFRKKGETEMTHKNLFNLVAVLGVVAILAGGVLAVRQAQAHAALAPQAGVSTAFTYQGRLTDSSTGDPIAGPCDFQFSLWDNGLTGSQVGSTQAKTNVALSNGYFGVALDFGAAAFQGSARYLQIAVQCPAGGGGYTPLSGRVELTAAPYAHSLRPGATIQGNVASGYVLSAENTATGMLAGDGLYGKSANGTGVYGESTASSGTTYGVYGKTSSPTGYGVYATNTAAGGGSDEPTALQAELNSADGFAVVGINYSGRGLYGEGHGRYGVGGFSDTSYGVFGKSTSGYAIYSDGKAHINGNLTWQAKTGYVSVSAAAFGPVHELYQYENWGNTLAPANLASRYYYAPVQLPHGATVTKIKFYWSDLSSDYNGHCYLYRNDMAAGGVTLGTVDTSGQAGNGSSETTTITYAVVDNSQFAYYVGWDLNGGGDVEGYGVVIEYTFTEPY
jgi:hypothetical protein